MDPDRVQEGAKTLQHPILHPIELNPEQGLTPDGAALLAVLLNPELRAIRDRRALADAQLLQAGILPNPNLSVSVEEPVAGVTAGSVTAFGLGLDWDATSLITRSAKINRATAHRDAVEFDIAWQEWQVAEHAKSLAYQLVTLQSVVDQQRIIVGDLQRNLSFVQKGIERGVLTQSDLSFRQDTMQKAEAELADLEGQADEARLKLNSTLGLLADSPIALKKSTEMPKAIDLANSDQLFEGLEDRRLDLVALRRGYDSQEEAVRTAVLNQFPKISIGPTFSRDTGNVVTAGIGLSISLPFFDRNQGQIAIERATRQQLFDAYQSRVFEARSDTELLLSHIKSLKRQLDVAHSTEELLHRRIARLERALKEERTSALALDDAQTELARHRKAMTILEGQIAHEIVALELTTGFYEIPRGEQTLLQKASVQK
ncbi:TolC family protein [bacterium]|nr:TolC family protein [bacterium]